MPIFFQFLPSALSPNGMLYNIYYMDVRVVGRKKIAPSSIMGYIVRGTGGKWMLKKKATKKTTVQKNGKKTI
jgi:hypothetical protein